MSDDGAPPSAQHLRLERWLPFRMFTISARVADVLTSFYGPRFGISRASWRTMAIVANHKGISAKEICKIAGLDQFAVSRAIGQLVDFGYAERRHGKSDKRYASLTLTDKGWSVFQEISDLAKRVDAELIDMISEDERAQLDAILNRLETASAGVLSRGWQGLSSPAAPTAEESDAKDADAKR